MKIISILLGVALIVLLSFSLNNETTSQNDFANFYEDKNYVEGELIVMLKGDSDLESFLSNYDNIDLQVKDVLVKDMNIYLLQYNTSRSQPVDALISVMRNSSVAIAQFNHTNVVERVIPNDTRFAEQWDRNNTGQTGGTTDADIDSPESWDVNTGNGLTVFGDTIVLAIVDGGQQLDHPDLNTWRNWGEIPGNSIDDDNNGYVDDVNGWNGINSNGTIPANSHGTHCAGIAGAKGNNGLGVAGVNMNVKTMPIVGSSGQEAPVVRAYGYVLKMRKLYNESNGTQGAFVVATNSSFGVDNGQPANYPLWCAFYDSLGAAGILSAGAGPNNNVNIDVVGDIPTTCPSNFMIAVTNTTNTDAKNSGAGYGPINMDLGAPGTAILSTLPGSTYGNNTGTSMATPQVTGAVGLIHAGASSLFMNLVKNDPDSAALLFKYYIMSSVDSIPSMATTVLSKGRLNVHKMVQKVRTTNVPVLHAFNLTNPAPSTRLVSLPLSNTVYTINWDTSATGATYKFVFGNPTIETRKIQIPSGINSVSFTSGQLDNMLAGLGLNQGDSLVGQWDAWAFRILPVNDSLKSSNGPRAITLKRGVPTLSAFNLSNPPNNTTIVTSTFNTGNVNINWNNSGSGLKYKWKFGNPTISNVRLTLPSNNSGYDTALTIANSSLDLTLAGLGLNPGDSLVGQWAVWAYTETDSLKSAQTYNLTLKRQSKGDVIILYDSTVATCRTSRDSVVNNLSALNVTFDLFNRKSNTTGTSSISFRGYKKMILLGEGTSLTSNVVKDSIKAYLNSGTTGNKAKLVIFGEDIAYHLDRAASTYVDTAFARGVLGIQFVLDRPASGANQGLTGMITNPGAKDSTLGPWPDVLQKPDGVPSSQSHNLYEFTQGTGTYNGLGRITPTYNVAVFGVDVESLRPSANSPAGSPVRRFVKGGLDYVDGLLTSSGNLNTSLIPEIYFLSQNYPNPFNPSTRISYSIPKSGIVSLKIYDILGKEVLTLVNELKAPGVYEVDFNGANLASGAYFYRISANEFTDIKRMVLIK